MICQNWDDVLVDSPASAYHGLMGVARQMDLDPRIHRHHIYVVFTEQELSLAAKVDRVAQAGTPVYFHMKELRRI